MKRDIVRLVTVTLLCSSATAIAAEEAPSPPPVQAAAESLPTKLPQKVVLKEVALDGHINLPIEFSDHLLEHNLPSPDVGLEDNLVRKVEASVDSPVFDPK